MIFQPAVAMVFAALLGVAWIAWGIPGMMIAAIIFFIVLNGWN